MGNVLPGSGSVGNKAGREKTPGAQLWNHETNIRKQVRFTMKAKASIVRMAMQPAKRQAVLDGGLL